MEIHLLRSSSNNKGGITTLLDTPIDVSEYSSLKVYISSNFNNYTTDTKFFIGVSALSTCNSYKELDSYTLVTTKKDSYISIDLSNIDGEIFIYMGGSYVYPASGELNARMFISEIYLE